MLVPKAEPLTGLQHAVTSGDTGTENFFSFK